MPVKSAKQWGLMGAIRGGAMKGVGGLTPEKAKEFMDATPKKDRSSFATAISKKRRHGRTH